MFDNPVPLMLAAILSFISFFQEEFCLYCSLHRKRLISFAAGISVTYIFLVLLPDVYQGTVYLDQRMFLFVLIGFVIFHLIEKHVFQHARKDELYHELTIVHQWSLFIYYVLAGIAIVRLVSANVLTGVLFFLPLVFHSAINDIVVHRSHEILHEKDHKLRRHARQKRLIHPLRRLFFASATLIGVVLATAFAISAQISFALTGLVAGMLFLLVIRETIPPEKEGDPLFFVIGVLAYTVTIALIWLV